MSLSHEEVIAAYGIGSTCSSGVLGEAELQTIAVAQPGQGEIHECCSLVLPRGSTQTSRLSA